MTPKTTSFERLHKWTVREANPALTGWRAAGVWTRLNIVERSGDGPASRRWAHWKAYRRLAAIRFDTMKHGRQVDEMTDVFWMGNEIMGIGIHGISPVRKACEELLRAVCPADYAPGAELPTAREILSKWTRWFDESYLNDTNQETGALLWRASQLASQTLAALDAATLATQTRTAPPGKKGARRI